jgi:hypothetical protein
MGIVKKINNQTPLSYTNNGTTYSKNELIQVSLDSGDSIPSELINGGWALKNMNINYEQTTENEYNVRYDDINNELVVCYNGTKKFIITPDSFTYNNIVYNNYTIGAFNTQYDQGENYYVKKIVLSNSVTKIGGEAFYCYNINEITIPNSVTIIEGNAFYQCGNLTSIVIPNSVNSIGSNAFYGCENLKNITLPANNNFTQLSSFLFFVCTSLFEITIPSSIISIGNYAFYGCSNLTNFNFEGTMSQWNNVQKGTNWNNGCLFTVVHCSDGDVNV